MKRATSLICTLLLSLGTASASGAVEPITTLDFSGAVMEGTSTDLLTGVGYRNALYLGEVSASISLLGGGGDTLATNWTATMNGFSFNGGGVGVGVGGGPAPLIYEGNGMFAGQNGTLDLAYLNGRITGASLDFHIDPSQCNGACGPADVSISTNGAASAFAMYGNKAFGTCENYLSLYGSSPYTGPNIYGCTLSAGSVVRGHWQVTAAPEIDPALASSALTFLFGVLVILLGRRGDAYRERAPAGLLSATARPDDCMAAP